jgi:hypothetical protein
MRLIKKQIVTDEDFNPVAVIINYHDWKRIEALLFEYEQNLLVDKQAVSLFAKSLTDEELNVFPIMQIAETGFAEWNDPEEDIYNDVA